MKFFKRKKALTEVVVEVDPVEEVEEIKEPEFDLASHFWEYAYIGEEVDGTPIKWAKGGGGFEPVVAALKDIDSFPTLPTKEMQKWADSYKASPYPRVLPKGALLIPPRLTKNEQQAVNIVKLLDGVELTPPLKAKLKKVNAGSYRVTLDENGKVKKVPKSVIEKEKRVKFGQTQVVVEHVTEK